MMRGPMAAEMMMGAQSKLEEAIEELREKYERKAELEAKAAMDADCRACQDNAKAAAEDAERERVNPTVDLTMEDPGLEALRQARLAELREKTKKTRHALGCGEYREITEEEFLSEVTSTPHVVLHFYHNDFITCKVMDKHLFSIAPRFGSTKFLKLNAEKSAFFTAKLKIRVLPTLVFFNNGIAVGRQLGFENLVRDPRDQDFPTICLVKVLAASGVLGSKEKERNEDSDYSDDDDVYNAEGGEYSLDGSGGGPVNMQERLNAARRAMLGSLDDDL